MKRKSAEDSGHYTITGLASELRACLANAGAQETSVILYAYLAAGQKIRHCRNHFCAAARAGTNCQDQITERQPSARSHDLAKLAISFHRLTSSALSRSNATSHCEYVFHGCECSYSLSMHDRTDRRATLLFNFKTRIRCKRLNERRLPVVNSGLRRPPKP